MSQRAAKRLKTARSLPFAHPPAAFLRLVCPAVLARCYPMAKFGWLPTALVALVFSLMDARSHCALAATSRANRRTSRLPAAALASVRLVGIHRAFSSLVHLRPLRPRAIALDGMADVLDVTFVALLRHVRSLTADFRNVRAGDFACLSRLDSLSTLRSTYELDTSQAEALLAACPGLRSLAIRCPFAALQHLPPALTELAVTVCDYPRMFGVHLGSPVAEQGAWRDLLRLVKLLTLTFPHHLLPAGN